MEGRGRLGASEAYSTASGSTRAVRPLRASTRADVCAEMARIASACSSVNRDN